MGLSRFDEIAELFQQVTRTPLHRWLRAAAVAALGPLQGRRVLDLGTGPGGLARDLADRGAEVLGMDGSPEMLRRAAEADQEAERPIRWIRGDAGRLPLRDGSVDDVAGMLVLHLLDDPVLALRECRRVARPAARFAFVTQSDDFGPDAAERLRGPLSGTERSFLQGCADSAASHQRLGRSAWVETFVGAGLPAPTITRAIPGVAWLLFVQLPAGEPRISEPSGGAG